MNDDTQQWHAVINPPRDPVATMIMWLAVRSPSHHARMILLDIEAWWFRSTKCQAHSEAGQLCGRWFFPPHWHGWV